MLDFLVENPGLTDAVIATIAGIVGSVWTAFKTSDAFSKWKNKRYYRAVQMIEAGVEQTYRLYVDEKKKAAADGKLTAAEIAEARILAMDKAKLFAKTEGLDLVRELGEEYFDHFLTIAVARAKVGWKSELPA